MTICEIVHIICENEQKGRDHNELVPGLYAGSSSGDWYQ